MACSIHIGTILVDGGELGVFQVKNSSNAAYYAYFSNIQHILYITWF